MPIADPQLLTIPQMRDPIGDDDFELNGSVQLIGCERAVGHVDSSESNGLQTPTGGQPSQADQFLPEETLNLERPIVV